MSVRELAATCFYIGHAPIGPGTLGSLAATAVAAALWRFAGAPAAGWVLLGLSAAMFGPGVLLGTWSERHYRRRDPPVFVFDEVVGCFLSTSVPLLLYPHIGEFVWVGGLPFLFFRIFDALKPFPVNLAERVRGGWGIMLDDIVAACFAVAATIAGLALFAGPPG